MKVSLLLSGGGGLARESRCRLLSYSICLVHICQPILKAAAFQTAYCPRTISLSLLQLLQQSLAQGTGSPSRPCSRQWLLVRLSRSAFAQTLAVTEVELFERPETQHKLEQRKTPEEDVAISSKKSHRHFGWADLAKWAPNALNRCVEATTRFR